MFSGTRRDNEARGHLPCMGWVSVFNKANHMHKFIFLWYISQIENSILLLSMKARVEEKL
jgi:hypothetical protein